MESVRGRRGVEAGTSDLTVPLAERRRRELRYQFTTVATRMFLERGFDAVRVSDVARACGVTEKTVFNHYPTKESLLADRWEPLIRDTERALLDTDGPILDTIGTVLVRELDELLAIPPIGDTSPLADIRRFTALVRTTPALVAHEHSEIERLTTVVAAVLGRHRGSEAVQPRPADWITAAGIATLFALFHRSLHQHSHASNGTNRFRQAVLNDLDEALDVLSHGL